MPVDGSVFIDEVVAHVDACSVSYAKAQGRSGDSVVEGESPAVFARRGHDGLGDREFIGHDFLPDRLVSMTAKRVRIDFIWFLRWLGHHRSCNAGTRSH